MHDFKMLGAVSSIATAGFTRRSRRSTTAGAWPLTRTGLRYVSSAGLGRITRGGFSAADAAGIIDRVDRLLREDSSEGELTMAGSRAGGPAP